MVSGMGYKLVVYYHPTIPDSLVIMTRLFPYTPILLIHTHTISCSEREATYVLSRLLSNKSVVNPQFHCTDTHRFTEHIFALCYLLRFIFCPRLKDLSEQRLYKTNKSQNYGEYDCLFLGVVDTKLIQENWDQIIRIVAALKNGHIPAHIIIQKLANRTDKVAKAVALFTF